MSEKHTPTPWQILPEEVDKPYIRIRGTVLGGRYKVANVLTTVYEGVPQREADETRANARRIVACVNACQGISTESLERSDVIASLQGELRRLEYLRDFLVARLKEADEDFALEGFDEDGAYRDHIRAAIAEAEGRAA